MKKMFIVALTGLMIADSHAQDYPGHRTGNYTGVNGVFFNPANMADSRFWFDVNLLSVSTLGSNSQASFRLKDISEVFRSENLKNQLFGENAGQASGSFIIDIHGPSAMMSVGKKNYVALTSRARMFANVVDVDGKLFDKVISDFREDPTLPYTVNSQENMKFSINAWSEYGAGFARILMDKGLHFLKGGLTLKYLGGAGNGHLGIENFRGTVNADLERREAYLQEVGGRITTGFGGMRIAGFEAKDLFTLSGSGFGTDIGFVYELRTKPDMQTTDGVRLNDDYTNTYTFKAGIAILDIGTIQYQKDNRRSGTYDIGINGDETLYLRELERRDVDDYTIFFDENPDLFNPVITEPETEYTVSLPTTLQLDADYQVAPGWYLSAATQIALSNNKTKLANNRPYSSFTFAPRYENKLFSAFLPLNYNSLSKLNAGLSFRVGPLFFGSGSVLTALFGNSKQADLHFGLRIGELK